MGNPTTKFEDYRRLKGKFDGNDLIMRAVRTGGNGRAGHRQRVANTPEWATDNAQLRAVLLRAFPRMNTNPTQRERAGRWASIINMYFRLSYTASHVAIELFHQDAKKAACADLGRDATCVKRRLMSQKLEQKILTKRVTDTVGRISRVAQGLRTDKRPRIGKMGRPRKV